MSTPSQNENTGISNESRRGWFFILLGLLCVWAGSFGFVFEMIRFLTPGSFPVGYDPSVDYAATAFSILLTLLGGLVVWRGFQIKNRGTVASRADRSIDFAMIAMSLLLGLVFCIGTMMLSANNAAAKQVVHFNVSVQRPDYSVPTFPTPAGVLPTPTYDPAALSQSGMITTSMDGLRAGDMQVRLSPDGRSVTALQITMYEQTCPVAEGNALNAYALPRTLQVLEGPFTVSQDGSFYAARHTEGYDVAVHGIVVSPTQTRGTLYLRYVEPGTQRVCDLGTFEWITDSPQGQ